jgi:SAM-dependent methyltransferase
MLPAGVRDVLEVGCGQGALGVRLAQRYQYVGLEPDQSSWAVAQRRVSAAGRGEVRNIRMDALGPEQFDLVCAFEVLEHIEDDVKALEQWREHLRPRGSVLLSVPAHSTRFRACDVFAGHFRRYDRDVLTRRLEEAGYCVVRLSSYGVPLGYLLEFARNQIARRTPTPETVEQRTAASGRFFQPHGATSNLAYALAAPFRLVQRPFDHTDVGIGYVVLAQRTT